MELPCLPAETPSTASSSATSTDPLYDNYCPPFAPRVVGHPSCLLAATGPLPATPCDNPGAAAAAGRAPTGPEGPTTLQGEGPGGGRGAGPGFWPDHSYCSWGGGLGTMQGCWDAELRVNRRAGGRIDGGLQGRERSAPSPSPQSDEHQSALSVYDNLHDAGVVTPDDLDDEEEEEEEGIAMETCSFQEDGTRRRHPVTGHMQQMMTMTTVEAEDGAASGGESSTWSSCEILLGGESADRTQEEVVPEQKTPEPDNMEVPPSPRLSHHLPTTSAAAGPPPPHPSQGAGLLQAQAGPLPPPAPHHPEELPVPRVPPPVPLADPLSSALRSILTSLTQQIGRQREDYEIRIYSLEQRNEELLMEVVGLRANLAQQKRWYQAVQARIEESEEARATAELHNAALQRELEQVFDTFGELNSEAMKTESIVRSF